MDEWDRSHYVPEGWEEANVGVCPHCDNTVRWDEDGESWVTDRTLRVLVLTSDEADAVRRSVSWLALESIRYQLDMQDSGEEMRQWDAERMEALE